jgi:CheY-like chemotaxis protein
VKVLVVEDNPALSRLTTRLLDKLGHESEAVDSGVDAVQRAAEFDMVLMDVHLTGLDGIAATSEIVARRDAGRPRIVGLTATAVEDERRRCLESGMEVVLAKPPRLADLEAALAPRPAA